MKSPPGWERCSSTGSQLLKLPHTDTLWPPSAAGHLKHVTIRPSSDGCCSGCESGWGAVVAVPLLPLPLLRAAARSLVAALLLALAASRCSSSAWLPAPRACSRPLRSDAWRPEGTGRHRALVLAADAAAGAARACA